MKSHFSIRLEVHKQISIFGPKSSGRPSKKSWKYKNHSNRSIKRGWMGKLAKYTIIIETNSNYTGRTTPLIKNFSFMMIGVHFSFRFFGRFRVFWYFSTFCKIFDACHFFVGPKKLLATYCLLLTSWGCFKSLKVFIG